METTTEIRVRYSETDGMGVVYHANYLVYCEVARTEFLDTLGFPYDKLEEAGVMSPVLHCDLTYGAPFRYGDTVVVRCKVCKLTAVRTWYSCKMYLKGEDPEKVKPRFSAVTEHCLVEKGTFKPLSQKRACPELYEAYQRVLEPLE